MARDTQQTTKKDPFNLYGSHKAIEEAAKTQATVDNLTLKLNVERPTEDDAPEYRRSYKDELPPEVFDVLVNKRILHTNGQPVMTILGLPDAKPLGRQPILSIDAWKRMIAADTTPDHRWTEWIFDKCAGGEHAKKQSKRYLETIKSQFINDRLAGYKHLETGEQKAPMTKQEAEALWTYRRPSPIPDHVYPSTEMRASRLANHSDQDTVTKHSTYGYYLKWPGGADRNYDTITKGVSKFIDMEELVVKLNKLVTQGQGLGMDKVSLDPKSYETIEALNNTIQKVERFFAAQVAAKDVRVANDKYIYSDDYVNIIVPLTYAAAVRYGWQEWAWANRENFEKLLMAKGANQVDLWQKHTRENLIAIMNFKKPMPGWVTRRRNEFKLATLTNLAVFIPISKLQDLSIQDDLKFWDEENRQNLTYAQIAEIIQSEPNKPENTEQDEMLPLKSWKVYKTKEEADKSLEHFNHALTQLASWAHSFNTKKIKSDTLTLDAPIKGKIGKGQPA